MVDPVLRLPQILQQLLNLLRGNKPEVRAPSLMALCLPHQERSNWPVALLKVPLRFRPNHYRKVGSLHNDLLSLGPNVVFYYHRLLHFQHLVLPHQPLRLRLRSQDMAMHFLQQHRVLVNSSFLVVSSVRAFGMTSIYYQQEICLRPSYKRSVKSHHPVSAMPVL